MKQLFICASLVLLASAAVVAIPAATAEPLTSAHSTLAADPVTHPPRLPENHEEVQQAIFFAVLEGLYLDGVDTETATLLSSIDEKTGAPRYFVYSCPICMPALDALRLYAGRPGFYGSKTGRDTFGPGISETTRALLEEDDAKVRIETFQALVLEWTDRYMENLRLTAEEHAVWARWIGGLREKGNAILESYLAQDGPYAEVYAGWEKCPSCEGSNGALGN